MQVLKAEIRERIFDAGVQVFYKKDFRSAKMQEIAERAGVSVSLLYSYYQNKEKLFEAIAASLPIDFDRIANGEARLPIDLPEGESENVIEEYLLDLLEEHKVLVIVMDKSAGTSYEHVKDDLIASIKQHINRTVERHTCRRYPGLLVHVLASNFTEGLLEIARHY